MLRISAMDTFITKHSKTGNISISEQYKIMDICIGIELKTQNTMTSSQTHKN